MYIKKSGVTPLDFFPRELFFSIDIRKNASKYAKLMVEAYICHNLNQIHRFFLFLTKKKLNLEIS